VLPSNTVQETVISGHPVDRFSFNTCAVRVKRFALTFFNSLKFTYRNNHFSLEEAEGGIMANFVGTFCTPQGLLRPALSSSLVGRVSCRQNLTCGFAGEYDGV